MREALYLGAPVIATDNGMRPPGVRLIPVSDRAALRETLFDVLSGGRQRTPVAGDGQENLRRVVELYGEILKG